MRRYYYEVKSNRGSGNERFDIIIYGKTLREVSIIIECKHSKARKEMKKDSLEVTKQIIEKRYIDGINEEGYDQVNGYGISFYEKHCWITKAKELL